ncbi:type IV conjugative transfer system protein TraE [Colwellia sp. MSW7]|uniref:Type IV conjugative transfer system protein TraE n=1 Tax=Colwellia maritima TaxID=2912588 RepID=A0ABS9X7I6_9GAMM|nr:type IV conjugative transfer system protein TraE [Colwellia maritima]MCI2286065.1 type IV conjugative transfer system protein TraE [Colwellia maritima]
MKKENSLVGMAYTDMLNTRKYMVITITVLSFVVAVLLLALIFKSSEYIVTPPSYTKALHIKNGAGNQEYQQQFALSIALMMGNIDSRNVEFVTDEVLKLMSPQLRSQTSLTLKREAQLLKVRKASQTFIVEDMMFSQKNDVVWVWGRKILTNRSGDKDSRRYTYEFRIEPINGYPRITYFPATMGSRRKKILNMSCQLILTCQKS